MTKSLQCVIDWLEAGCDPKEAAEELRAIAALAQPVQPAKTENAFICNGCGGIYWVRVSCDCNMKSRFKEVSVTIKETT